KGKSLEQVLEITNRDVAEALDGLPTNKLHCSNLGADALQLAIKDYEGRKTGKSKKEPKRKDEHLPSHGGETCYCPYCDTEIPEGEKICKTCQLPVEDDQ
ncbi:MAG: iron-sulfur cluster assembly scaffold protein, partial [Deltaproteobacteria bacterium]